MITSMIFIIGAAHVDLSIHIGGPISMGRTNPASQQTAAGGVAANIARYLASDKRSAPSVIFGAARGQFSMRVQFLGVSNLDQFDSLARHLYGFGIKSQFVTIAGQSPSYTAILDNAGELVIGAACMDLYDAITPDDVIPYLPQTGSVVMDANFPEKVLRAVAETIPLTMSLFAAGTSIEKVERLLPIMGRLDGLVLNRAEAAMLVAKGSTAQMAQQLAALMRSRGFVLVSDGADVAALAQDGVIVEAAPKPLETSRTIRSVNGAGDAMAARLFGLYLQGASRIRPTSDILNELLQDALAAGAAFAAGESNV